MRSSVVLATAIAAFCSTVVEAAPAVETFAVLKTKTADCTGDECGQRVIKTVARTETVVATVRPTVRARNVLARQADESGYSTSDFRVTVCPRPTGTNGGQLDPKSDLTFGCKPGFICDPPKPEGCNWWAEPPTDDYVCPPDSCIKAPAYKQVQWEEDETYYYPPDQAYFALNPNAFALAYDIFEVTTTTDSEGRTITTGNWGSQTGITEYPQATIPPEPTTSSSTTTTTTTTITVTSTTIVPPPPPPPSTSTTFTTITTTTTTTVPGVATADVEPYPVEEERKRAAAMLQRRALHWWKTRDLPNPGPCFDDCMGPWKIAESIGKTDELCEPDGDFMINHDACTFCVDTKADEAKENKRDYVDPIFAQFLNFCEARDPEPTPTPTPSEPEPQEPSSTSVSVSTTDQDPPNTSTSEPVPPSSTTEDRPPTTTQGPPPGTTTSESVPPTTEDGPPPTTTDGNVPDDQPTEGPATTTGGQGGGVVPPPVGGDDDNNNDNNGDDNGADNGDDAPVVPAPAPEDVTSGIVTFIDTTTDASGAEITTTRTSMAVFGTATDDGGDIPISTGVTMITTTTQDAQGNVITTTSESALWGVASAMPKPDGDDDDVVFQPPKDDDEVDVVPTPGAPEEVPIAGASSLVGSSFAFTLFIMFAVIA